MDEGEPDVVVVGFAVGVVVGLVVVVVVVFEESVKILKNQNLLCMYFRKMKE